MILFSIHCIFSIRIVDTYCCPLLFRPPNVTRGALDPAKNATFPFVESLLADYYDSKNGGAFVDKFVHLGADEVRDFVVYFPIYSLAFACSGQVQQVMLVRVVVWLWVRLYDTWALTVCVVSMQRAETHSRLKHTPF
jgi:hypothetical protein